MKIYNLFVGVAVLLLPQLAMAQASWKTIETADLRVSGEVVEKDLQRVAAQFAATRAVLQANLNRAEFVSTVKTNVFVFHNKSAASRFQAGAAENFSAVNLSDEPLILQRVRRDYADDILRRNFGRTRFPAWLNQGLSEIAAGNSINDGEIENYLPLENLTATDYFAFGNLDGAARRDFDSQSAALIRYFLDNQKNREKFNRFLELILHDKSPQTALKTIFGSDLAALDKDFRRFAAAPPKTTEAAAKVESKPFAISVAEANWRLAEIFLHFDQLTEAAEKAQLSLSLNANSSAAHTTLGAVLGRQKKFAEARVNLEKAIALDDKNFLAHFRLAHILSVEDGDENGFVAEHKREKFVRIQNLLERTIELSPNFAAAYQLSAQVNLINNANFAESLASLDKAAALEPGNQSFALERANVLLRLENYAAAREIAVKIAAYPGDKNIRLEARTLIASLNFIASRLREENAQTGDRQSAPSKVLTPDEAYLQSLNEALRKVKSDEQRVLGYLNSLECGTDGVLFVVRNGLAPQLKFHAAEIKKVRMTAFVPNLDGRNLACGKQSPAVFVVATFKTKNEKQTNPELVALEFVPENFRFLSN